MHEPVTVTLSVVPLGKATLTPTSITIAAGNQSAIATLTSIPDADYMDETLTVVATGTGITGSQNVNITVTDPPSLVMTVSAAPTTIAEGGTSTITAMANRPVTAADGPVTVTLNVSPPGKATLTPTSITIAAGDQSGIATLTSIPDADYMPETLTVVATGTGITSSEIATIIVTDPPPSAPFTDDPIQPGVTPVKAMHFTELRTRIDALRRAEGLQAFSWTDPFLRARVTKVRLVHLLELREALGAAYTAAGRAVPPWRAVATTGGSTPIQAAHVTELREAVLALE